MKIGPWAGNVILAPMSQGSNAPFRRLCVSYGAQATLSEMVFASSLCQGKRREQALIRRYPGEPCFGVQILAADPLSAAEAARQAAQAGADFVDLNAGCPIDMAIKKGMGSRLIDRPNSLERILTILVQQSPLPVTTKLRTGFKDSKINILETSAIAENAGVAGLVVHGRTQQQRYTGCANWELIGETAQARTLPVIGNGDILTWYEAEDRLATSQAAGIMIGRGALIKPWIFQEIREKRDLLPTTDERLEIYLQFAALLLEHFGDDDYGQRSARNFFAWHCDFFYRYHPLPESEYRAASREHPLIQTRLSSPPTDDPVARALADSNKNTHKELARLVVQCRTEQHDVAWLREQISQLYHPSQAEVVD